MGVSGFIPVLNSGRHILYPQIASTEQVESNNQQDCIPVGYVPAAC